MIEINLLPGATRRSKRRLPSFSLKRSPKHTGDAIGGAKSADPWKLFVLGGWIAGPALIGLLFFTSSAKRTDLQVAIEGARLDSTRYAEIRAANVILIARQDTIAQKLEIIQQIDAGRYIWAHVVDEVSRAVPEYTWLINLMYVSSPSAFDSPKFVIDGRAGNTFKLTQFMQDLEASPFIRNVTLVQTDQIREKEKLLYSFALEAQFQVPGPELIRTVPIFSREGQ